MYIHDVQMHIHNTMYIKVQNVYKSTECTYITYRLYVKVWWSSEYINHKNGDCAIFNNWYTCTCLSLGKVLSEKPVLPTQYSPGYASDFNIHMSQTHQSDVNVWVKAFPCFICAMTYTTKCPHVTKLTNSPPLIIIITSLLVLLSPSWFCWLLVTTFLIFKQVKVTGDFQKLCFFFFLN